MTKDLGERRVSPARRHPTLSLWENSVVRIGGTARALVLLCAAGGAVALIIAFAGSLLAAVLAGTLVLVAAIVVASRRPRDGAPSVPVDGSRRRPRPAVARHLRSRAHA